jgi:hypothetical protein
MVFELCLRRERFGSLNNPNLPAKVPFDQASHLCWKKPRIPLSHFGGRILVLQFKKHEDKPSNSFTDTDKSAPVWKNAYACTVYGFSADKIADRFLADNPTLSPISVYRRKIFMGSVTMWVASVTTHAVLVRAIRYRHLITIISHRVKAAWGLSEQDG